MVSSELTLSTRKIGEVAKVIPGYAFKSKDWCDTGLPVIKIKNITGDGSINTNRVDCVPASLMNPKLEKFLIRNGDVLVAMTGATAGKVGRLRSTQQFLLNQRVAKLVPVDIHPVFLWSVVSSKEYQERFFKLADGAAQPNMSSSQIEGVEVPFPPFPTQRKIAAILSAYDDLIENNLRRIKILEEMSQNLYHEWFIKFRFPGHQHTRFTDSSLGQIPENWNVRKLGDIADISWGDTSTTKASYVETGFAAYSASGLDGKLDHYDFDRTGIVLSAIGAQCGKTWLARNKWSCIKNTIRFWSKNERVSTEFLFVATRGQHFWPRRGAAQPFISQGDAKRIDLLTPDHATMKRFTTFAANTLEQIAMLQTQIQNLRRTRDLLLTRLISGDVDVSELDISVPEEAVA